MEEKKFSLLLKTPENVGLWPENSTFSTKLNFFSSDSNFDFSSRGNSKWPYVLDCCISLNSVQNFLVVLGVVDMCHLLLMVGKWPTYINIRKKFVKFANFCVSGLFQWWSSSSSNSRSSISDSNKVYARTKHRKVWQIESCAIC